MQQLLPFSFNWNQKLHCNYFTTLRLTDRFIVGEKVTIQLKGRDIGEAEIIDKRFLFLKDLKLHQCVLDTGYGVEETQNILKKMYPRTNWENTPIFYYLLKQIKQ